MGYPEETLGLSSAAAVTSVTPRLSSGDVVQRRLPWATGLGFPISPLSCRWL